MPATLSFCKVCSKRFMLKPEEMATLAQGHSSISLGARRLRFGCESPTTWSEWVEHVLNHCPDHRLKEMPEEVEADYVKRITSRTLPAVIKADEDSDESDREEGEAIEGDIYDTWFPRIHLN